MIRALGVIVLVLALTGTAGASLRPPVPLAAQAQIARKAPSLAYVPTRMALGFHYSGWLKTPTTVETTFDNKAGWEIRFVALRLTGACRAGMEKSFQLDGNKVYWSHTGAEQQAWRCVTGRNGQRVRLVASSPQPATKFADVGLGRVVASGKRIAT